jgi:uncharacterized membrane protein
MGWFSALWPFAGHKRLRVRRTSGHATAKIHASAISDDGSVIVGTQSDPGSVFNATGEALLWNLSGVHYIRDLLIAAGVAPSAMLNWKLGFASAVSGDGKVIAGAGTAPNGLQEAWIARLP